MRRIAMVFILFLFALVLAPAIAAGQASWCDQYPYLCGIPQRQHLDEQLRHNEFLQEQGLRDMQRRMEEERLERQRRDIEERRFQELLWELRRHRR